MSRLTITSIVFFALFTGLSRAEPLVRLPAEVKGQPGDFLVVKADTQGKIVRWYAPDPGLSLFPSELLRDTKTAVVIGRQPGRYRLVAYTAEGDAPSPVAETVVVLGNAPPPGPEPGPGPTPPPPPPSDPLVRKLQEAYGSEQDAGKATLLPKLASVYRHGSEAAQGPSVSTWDGLFGSMSRKAQETGTAGKLMGVQKILRDEVLNVFPSERTKPMDTDGRALAKVTLLRAAQLVESVKP